MKLTKLTSEQKDLLKVNKDKFVKRFLNNEKINIPIAKEVIGFVYSLIKKEMPKIYIAGNPLEAQKLANELKDTKKKFYQFGTYLSIYFASFYAYYETFVDLGMITEDKFPKYFKLRKFIDSNIFMTIEFENAIILIEKPLICLKNNNGLHNISGKAIEWKDGYGQYYINGRCISEKLFNQLLNKSYTFEDFSKEENEEIKSSVLAFYQEKFGDVFLFDFLSKNLKEINTYIDKKKEEYLRHTTKSMNLGVYTLFKGKINNTDVAYVRCFCPSTDRMFFLGVNPDNNNAKDAIASLCQIPKVLKDNLISISRQGEIFSFKFDNNILDNLKKEELSDVVSLTGNEYFSKIIYEY